MFTFSFSRASLTGLVDLATGTAGRESFESAIVTDLEVGRVSIPDNQINKIKYLLYLQNKSSYDGA